jgi:hypothetical protein
MLVVSSDLRALVVFFVPAFFVQLVVWTNIRFVTSHVCNWNSHSTFLFVISYHLGNFNKSNEKCGGVEGVTTRLKPISS